MKKTIILLIAFCFIVILPHRGWPSVSGKVKEAGRLVKDGDYEAAVEKYDEAMEIRPDDPVIKYNRAVALFRNDEIAKAFDAFLLSFSDEEDGLKERPVYNAGNSKYRIAGSMEKENTAEAISGYKDAADFYKKAMEVSPEDMDAKVNYEMTLKKIKELEEKQEQQQDQKEDQKQDQKQDQQQDQKQDQQQNQKQDQQQGQKQDQKQDQQQDQKQDQQQDQKQDQQQDQKQGQKQDQQKDQQQDQGQGVGEKGQDENDQKEQNKNLEQDQDEKDEQNQGEPDKIGGGSWPARMSSPGEMTEQEARMMLMGQEEEEGRLRAEMADKRKGGRPRVLKNW